MYNAQPYTDNENYIYANFSPSDEEKAMPAISLLADRGYRVWYNAGARYGLYGTRECRERLFGCILFIFFNSESYFARHECCEDLYMAVRAGKKLAYVTVDGTSRTIAEERLCRGFAEIDCRDDESFLRGVAAVDGAELCNANSNVGENADFVLRRIATGEIIPINKPKFALGRKPELCDYSIESNPALTRVHAIFRVEGGKLFVSDNHSTNYTKINGMKIVDQNAYELRNNDIVTCADEKFAVIIKKGGRL